MKVPEHLKWTWPCWRLITEDKATWTEVTSNMSLMDVMYMNDALNTVYEYKNRLQEEANKK